MSAAVEYRSDTASEADIAEHLLRCNTDFVPPLSDRVDIRAYAKKIARSATRFEAWSRGTLVGLVAAYCNDREGKIAYITSFSVLGEAMGQGVGTRLMGHCVEHAGALGMRRINLEVGGANAPAIGLYEKTGFRASAVNGSFVSMDFYLDSGDEHEQQA